MYDLPCCDGVAVTVVIQQTPGKVRVSLEVEYQICQERHRN
jgi:hypothetical protein